MALPLDLSTLDDHELSELLAAAQEEQYHRALSRGDLDALVEEGFSIGFSSGGVAGDPYLRGSVLVCPGSVVEKSTMSHDCVFAHVENEWVWDSPHLLLDSVRKVPDRSRTHQRSVSLVAAIEGLEFDVVASKMRQNVHTRTASRSYAIRGGELELISARTVSAAKH